MRDGLIEELQSLSTRAHANGQTDEARTLDEAIAALEAAQRCEEPSVARSAPERKKRGSNAEKAIRDGLQKLFDRATS